MYLMFPRQKHHIFPCIRKKQNQINLSNYIYSVVQSHKQQNSTCFSWCYLLFFQHIHNTKFIYSIRWAQLALITSAKNTFCIKPCSTAPKLNNWLKIKLIIFRILIIWRNTHTCNYLWRIVQSKKKITYGLN